MHAFLITQSTSENRLQYANKLIGDRGVNVNHIFRLVRSEEKKSIGIEDTTELKRWMGQVSTKPRVALIEEAQLLTVPAQQSLLKVIEEPEDSILIILTADSEMSLLPTVRSRCKIIRLRIEKKASSVILRSESASDEESSEAFEDFPLEKKTGEKILWLYGKLSEYAGKRVSPHQGSIGREIGIGFVEKIIGEISDQSLVNSYQGRREENQNRGKILNEAAKAHQKLKQNISSMLVLQEFVLRI